MSESFELIPKRERLSTRVDHENHGLFTPEGA
jgi:hypothetical protein